MGNLDLKSLSCDVLVAGGGPAGVPCALAAARNGASVVLCQDRSVLGGNASSEVRMHIVGADNQGARSEELATEARETGIIEEIRLDTSVRNPQKSASMLDLILYEKCRAEENLTLLLNTAVVGVEMADGRITHARAERQSTEDAFRIEAKVFIDCTGDGRVALEAGAAYQHGREGKEEFGESLAQTEADSKTLGSTILFQARKHDRPMPFIAPPWARKFSEADLRLRPHGEPGLDKGLEYGYWWAEWGGHLDTVKDNEAIRDELLAVTLGIWDHVKNSGDHGADNWALEWFGFLPGKRESRRFKGLYTLTEADVFASTEFADAIAYGGWPIDLHPPEGVDRPEEKPCDKHMMPHLFDVPLRSCISRDVSNLMFAGRNMSATHVAFASTRVMATCAIIGQGVGVSAAQAVASGMDPEELAADDTAMKRVQQTLLRDDCYLIGRSNSDDGDLALRAMIRASSEQQEGPAENVVSGQTRSVHGKNGAPPQRAVPGAHRWMSQPSEGLPAWLEMRWKAPVHVKEIQIVFDTGLHRLLTLSHCDSYSPDMVWGRPQPETVKDYTIEGQIDGKWTPLEEVSGNWQRLRRHILGDPQKVEAIRVLIHATNGMDHARVCEVRVYS